VESDAQVQRCCFCKKKKKKKLPISCDETRLDQGAGHDRASVNHGVVRLVILAQDEVVEAVATGLVPNVLMDLFLTDVLEGDAIRYRLIKNFLNFYNLISNDA